MNRVVITGVGVVSAIGNNADEFWRSLAAGRSGIGPITKVDVSEMRFRKGAEVKGFEPKEHFDDRLLTTLDTFAQYGVVAAREAAADSGVEFDGGLGDETGVITGSCLGGQDTEDALFFDIYANKKMRVPPLTIPRSMGNSVASNVSMEFGLRGATYTLSTACSSANHAIGHAFWLIRQGTLDAAIAGGSEAPFSFGHLKAWEAMRVVASDTCRPFSKDRSGMVLGEGGAMFVLERMDKALERGAKIYAEIVGFGMSADAHHLTMPSADGAARAMRSALKDGAVEPDEVGYINAHGTATQANDPMEATAIRSVFETLSDNIPVSSTKSMHGHTLGAAGAVEAAATVLALSNGVLPPTANFTELDPGCPLDVIAGNAREASPAAALSNSFAFGGLNAVLAFRRFDAR